KKFALYQNYPNPFNPLTKIKYTIPVVIVPSEEQGKQSRFVTLKVYDVLGNEVATLVNEEKSAGTYELEFSTKGGYVSAGTGTDLSSGIYFYKLQAGDFIETKKMIVIK
ncbi:MAG TPA: T9SS type A sorting domain-containing protein, partial [Ignavibacteriaceae bacterium]